jgi:orotate phosphoribosyltransferase-like protein
MTIKKSILNLFSQSNDLSIKEIVDTLLVSKQAVHYAINQLLEEQKIEKLGRAPKTVYRLLKQNSTVTPETTVVLDNITSAQLQKKVLVITEIGKMLTGIEGFTYWCNQRKLPIEKTLIEYLETQKKYDSFFEKNNLIDGTDKLKNTKGYNHIWLDKLYYCDFYAIERFGKTRLGTLLHYAKQGQNKMLMKILVDEIRVILINFINETKADAVGFVPPTIRREVQIMKFIETQLKLSLPIIKINKISGLIPVPQKSLNKLEERIRNAENTFSVTEKATYRHVILIDDAVGSGSTLNEIAGKIKNKKITNKITGLAIVGSFKGFDVVTDV